MRLATVAANNKTGNYVLGGIALVGLYFGMAYVPMYLDNMDAKSLARDWIVRMRQPDLMERAPKRFFGEASSVLRMKLTEEHCQYTEAGKDQSVTCRYGRDVEFLFTDKKRPIKFKWTVTMHRN